MNFRPRPQEELDVNITPLIDIVFLLLIFFMISTTFKQEFEVGIELPQASSEKRMTEKVLEITIDSSGVYYLNRKKLVNNKVASLKRGMQKLSAGDIKLPVVISADAKTPHEAVIRAMDAARQLGFTRLTFATQQIAE